MLSAVYWTLTEMADVKCSLVSLIMSGEMTVSIRWTGLLLQAVVDIRPWEPPKMETV